MKLVIDISEEMYERIKDGYVPLGISKCLKNGIPLTKWLEETTEKILKKGIFERNDI